MATITIPTPYLKDAREAAARELKLDGELLHAQDADDRALNLLMLDRSVGLYRQLNDATGTVELSSTHDHHCAPINHMLDEVVRLLAARLNEAKEYGPVPMGDVLQIAEELRWAATEAIRIEPTSDAHEPGSAR